MSVLVRKHKLSEITEDSAEQNDQEQATSVNVDPAVSQKIQMLNSQIVQCQNAINVAERRYNEEKQKQNNNIVQLQKQISDLGGTPVDVATNNESIKYVYAYSRNLYESVQQGKTEELANIIDSVFANLTQLSYYMDKKGCLTLAKRLLSFLNDQNWNDGENHWEEVAEFLDLTLSKANISLSTREKSEFIEALRSALASSAPFSWIFGRTTPVPEEIEDPEYSEDIY